MKSTEMKKITFYRKTIPLLWAIVLGIALAVTPVAAFSPTFVVGSSAEYNDSSFYGDSMWYDLYGMGSWRTAFDGGYTALSGSARIEYNPEDGGTSRDTESAEFMLGLDVPGGSAKLSSAVATSLDDPFYGTIVQPEWGGEYTWAPKAADNSLEPYLGYAGYYLYQGDKDFGTNDRHSHEGYLGLRYEPSIMRGYRLEASGAAEYYLEEHLLNEDGSEKNGLRSDYIVSGEAEMSGLWGFFADWSLLLSGGGRFSDGAYFYENIYENIGTVQKNYYDSCFGGLEGELSWSPSRAVQLSSIVYTDLRRYTDRKAYEDEDATALASAELTTFDLGGTVEADWTPDDRWFFVFRVFGGKTFSNDPTREGWNFGIGGGIEYGF